jgi:hypothetical protein
VRPYEARAVEPPAALAGEQGHGHVLAVQGTHHLSKGPGHDSRPAEALGLLLTKVVDDIDLGLGEGDGLDVLGVLDVGAELASTTSRERQSRSVRTAPTRVAYSRQRRRTSLVMKRLTPALRAASMNLICSSTAWVVTVEMTTSWPRKRSASESAEKSVLTTLAPVGKVALDSLRESTVTSNWPASSRALRMGLPTLPEACERRAKEKRSSARAEAQHRALVRVEPEEGDAASTYAEDGNVLVGGHGASSGLVAGTGREKMGVR